MILVTWNIPSQVLSEQFKENLFTSQGLGIGNFQSEMAACHDPLGAF